MTEIDVATERTNLAASIALKLRDVGEQWRRLQEIDRGASGLQFRATLRACNLPGGLRVSNQSPLN